MNIPALCSVVCIDVKMYRCGVYTVYICAVQWHDLYVVQTIVYHVSCIYIVLNCDELQYVLFVILLN